MSKVLDRIGGLGVDAMDVIAIVSAFFLFCGLCIVFGFGVALIVHGVLGLVFVFGTELMARPWRKAGG